MQPGFHGLGFPGHFGTDLRHTGPVYGFLAIPRNDTSSGGGSSSIWKRGKKQQKQKGPEWQGGARGFFVAHDGCRPFSPEEAAHVRGRVAVLLRGGCSFAGKTRRVEVRGVVWCGVA
jgi:hypothetical protein